MAQIRALRKIIPNCGKQKLHILLLPWCAERALPCPSSNTIGRLIKDAGSLRMRPPALTSKGKSKRYQRQPVDRHPKNYKPQAPGVGLALDTIHRHLLDLKGYILTLCSRLMPFPIRQIITDNGSEFKAHFAKHLKNNHIKHLHTYPRSPKMNAKCERFNRAIQEQFVDYHEQLLFEDVNAFNQKLADWLFLYNSFRPHHGLQLKTPLQCILQIQPKCNMWWAYTISLRWRNGRLILSGRTKVR